MNRETIALDTADILAACVNCVPANAPIDQAIAAHLMAFKAADRDPDARQLAVYALHAVVLARTATIDDYRAQLDYLSGLPETAWPDSVSYSAQEIREATLAAIRRQIAWVTACV
jgi:hypothetical protein